MLDLDVLALFERLRAIPGLQDSRWDLNQGGVDRGLEAVLIQGCTREMATYALVLLRLACMPDLVTRDYAVVADENELQALLAWAKAQKSGGCTTLAKLLTKEKSLASSRAIAAAASLRYYRNRRDLNPVVKEPWTEEGLATAAVMRTETLLDPPLTGGVWARKFLALVRLVNYIMETPLAQMTDEEVCSSLQSLPGIGPQTASMVALFWLGRPEPIIDDYLLRVLTGWALLPSDFNPARRMDRECLRGCLKAGAVELSMSLAGFTPTRILGCLYCWACETARFRLGGIE